MATSEKKLPKPYIDVGRPDVSRLAKRTEEVEFQSQQEQRDIASGRGGALPFEALGIPAAETR